MVSGVSDHLLNFGRANVEPVFALVVPLPVECCGKARVAQRARQVQRGDVYGFDVPSEVAAFTCAVVACGANPTMTRNLLHVAFKLF